MGDLKKWSIGALVGVAWLLDWSSRIREASTRTGEFTFVNPFASMGLLSWLSLASLVAAALWVLWPWPWKRAGNKAGIVYDTKLHGWVGFFDHEGWFDNEDKTGELGKGEVHVDLADQSILVVRRLNTSNRYSLEFRRYIGGDAAHPPGEIAADLSIDGPRWIRVAFEARSIRGSHKLDVFVQYKPSGSWLDSDDRPRRLVIGSETWNPFWVQMKTRAGEACYVRIDSVSASAPGDSFAIKNLRIEVEGRPTK